MHQFFDSPIHPNDHRDLKRSMPMEGLFSLEITDPL